MPTFNLPLLLSAAAIAYCIAGLYMDWRLLREFATIDKDIDWAKQKWWQRPAWFLLKLIFLAIGFVLWPLLAVWIFLW